MGKCHDIGSYLITIKHKDEGKQKLEVNQMKASKNMEVVRKSDQH